jgi:hypothetical protein
MSHKKYLFIAFAIIIVLLCAVAYFIFGFRTMSPLS